jgi:uncharacterized Zn finger protein
MQKKIVCEGCGLKYDVEVLDFQDGAAIAFLDGEIYQGMCPDCGQPYVSPVRQEDIEQLQ